MTVTIPNLPAKVVATLNDEDLLIIYNGTGVAPFTRRITLGDLFRNVVVEDGDHELGEIQIQLLTAITASINEATIVTSLAFEQGATVGKVYEVTQSVTPANIPSNSAVTTDVTLTGIEVADHLNFSFDAALPNGVTAEAWISAPGTVTIKFYNHTGVTVNSFSIEARLHAIRFTL